MREYKLILGSALTDDELRESCDFDETDLAIANQTQIDFVLICDPDVMCIPRGIQRNLNNSSYQLLHRTFHDELKSIFIFWH